jgi:hypothetical protein
MLKLAFILSDLRIGTLSAQRDVTAHWNVSVENK